MHSLTAVPAGRVHPGESNASWMMRGLLEMLTGPSAAAIALRNQYIFMVVQPSVPDAHVAQSCVVSY